MPGIIDWYVVIVCALFYGAYRAFRKFSAEIYLSREDFKGAGPGRVLSLLDDYVPELPLAAVSLVVMVACVFAAVKYVLMLALVLAVAPFEVLAGVVTIALCAVAIRVLEGLRGRRGGRGGH